MISIVHLFVVRQKNAGPEYPLNVTTKPNHQLGPGEITRKRCPFRSPGNSLEFPGPLPKSTRPSNRISIHSSRHATGDRLEVRRAADIFVYRHPEALDGILEHRTYFRLAFCKGTLCVKSDQEEQHNFAGPPQKITPIQILGLRRPKPFCLQRDPVRCSL